MDRDTQDLIARTICFGIGCVTAYYVLMWLLPYLFLLLVFAGIGYALLASFKNNGPRR